MTRETKAIVVLHCDLHVGEEVEAEQTVSFAANGTTYEVELCAEHLAAFNEAIEPFTARARPVTGRRARARAERTEPVAGDAHSGEEIDGAAIREWARSNGYEISDRGRLSQPVMDAFAAAQGHQGE